MQKALFSIIVWAALAQTAFAAVETVTPYGDSCPLCGDYGYCNKQPTRKEAVVALKTYYRGKGLHVMTKKQEGRFLEAEIYKNNKMIDRVLLDLRTGLIRSIH
jgi:hypothetical protein